jgi:D-3-phosphoglycerate dehydrogenase
MNSPVGPSVFIHATADELVVQPSASVARTQGASPAVQLEPFATILRSVNARLSYLEHDSVDAFIDGARHADAIVGGWRGGGRPIDRDMLESLTRCRIIALCVVGADRIDLAAATVRGIPVTNVPDTFIQEVADHAMMLLLSAWRRLPELERMARDGRWKQARPLLNQFPRLLGQTLGLIGFGNVGRAVAHRARAFGLRVVAYDPYIDELTMIAHDAEPVNLDELLARSDFVSLHTPSSEETRSMIGAEHFALMKKTAIFINTARGANVDEDALVVALEEERIAGAALDVAVMEPLPESHRLAHLPNVILTPHVGSASARMEPVRKERAAREVLSVLQGQWPRACVNPAVLQHSGLARWQPVPTTRGKAS